MIRLSELKRGGIELVIILATSLLFMGADSIPEKATADYNSDIIAIPGGTFIPQYGSEGEKVTIPAFRLDKYPVTNEQFFAFVRSHPEWSREAALSLTVDKNYLAHWEGDAPREVEKKAPVVRVSWFAASEFCVARGGRLPTTFEWEYVAAASATSADASQDPEYLQQILNWYSRPDKEGITKKVGTFGPNYHGLYDLHGLIWEWTLDFNSLFTSGDNREDGEKDGKFASLFCGAGATGSADPTNYAAFMRYALRNSLKANFTTAHLGFRCAYDHVEGESK